MNTNLTLICSRQTNLSRWIAQSLIEKQRREFPEVPVAFLFFMRKSDGEIVLANRNMHWVSQLDAEAAKAAALGVAFSYDQSHDVLRTFVALRSFATIACVAEREDCPIEPTTIIHIT